MKQNRLLAGVGIIVLLLALAWWQRPDGRLHVVFLDTPGDAVLVQTPRGGYLLLDGGEDATNLALHLGRRLPFWQRSLRAVVLTRVEPARLGGQVAALKRYRARQALAPPLRPALLEEEPALVPLLAEWERELRAQHTPLRLAAAGDRLDIDGVRLTVVSVEQAGNAAEMVLTLDYGTTRVVLAQAWSSSDEAALLATARPATLVAYPWQRAPSAALCAAWQPRAMMLTDGLDAAKPALLTFAERRRCAPRLYHQKLHGTVELVSDGRTAWIETEF